MIRSLLFSTLYPSAARPNHGIFVETRLRHLLRSGRVDVRVVAPVPWFPFSHPVFGEYAQYAVVPRAECWNGIAIAHPRYPLLPKIGMNDAPRSLAATGLNAARRLIDQGFDFDLIDAHYFYPDGVAAVLIGKALGKPVFITARGTDINLIPDYPKPRQRIVDAARGCAGVITVSAALKQKLVDLGVDPDRVTVLRNGVDLDLFSPMPQEDAKARLKVDGYLVVSVGNLVRNKGHHCVIEAMTRLPDVRLLIAGHGPEHEALLSLANRLGVGARVRLIGSVPQAELRQLYAAADCLVLASEREGWPNILLEAMACGTPVIATRVGGVPEIVATDVVGRVIESQDPATIAAAINALREDAPARAHVRQYAEQFGWDATTEGQLALFSSILEQPPCAT